VSSPRQYLDGKYRLGEPLGRGGMGEVRAAFDMQLQRPVAIKRLLGSECSPRMIGRFLREARLAAQLSGEHVTRIIDVGVCAQGNPYIVMEFLQGCNLATLLRERGELDPERAVSYLLQACLALAEAHAKGIVHRDLKPDNLFLARRPDGSQLIKVLDFGISKASEQGGAPLVTCSQVLLGTPVYMSPEQMRNVRRVDARADIWSLGVILYELVSNQRPFPSDSLPVLCAQVLTEEPAPLGAEVPAALRAVIFRCIEKKPTRRYQTVAELARALQPFAPPGSEAIPLTVERMLGRPEDSTAARDSRITLPEAVVDSADLRAPVPKSTPSLPDQCAVGNATKPRSRWHPRRHGWLALAFLAPVALFFGAAWPRSGPPAELPPTTTAPSAPANDGPVLPPATAKVANANRPPPMPDCGLGARAAVPAAATPTAPASGPDRRRKSGRSRPRSGRAAGSLDISAPPPVGGDPFRTLQ
jgi:serine/threonine-protein kinase